MMSPGVPGGGEMGFEQFDRRIIKISSEIAPFTKESLHAKYNGSIHILFKICHFFSLGFYILTILLLLVDSLTVTKK